MIDTALCLFTEHGYLGVRVEDIAKAAGVSRATFYTHFSEREQILAALLDRLLGEAGPDTDPDAEPASVGSTPRGSRRADVHDRVRAVLGAAMTRMVEQPELARFVYSLPVRHEALLHDDQVRVPPTLAHVDRLVADAVAGGELRADIPIEVLVRHVHAAFETAMRDWAAGRVEHPRERLDQLLDLVFQGAQAPRRR